MTNRLVPLLAFLALLGLHTAPLAQIYSCPGPDGTVSYRQTPCPEAEPKAEEAPQPVPEDSSASCQAAGRLAFSAARLMHGGLASGEALSELGGAELTAAARRLIDAVFAYRGDPDLTAEQIAALSETLCRSGSFGDLNCGDLPAGCDGSAVAAAPTQRPVPAAEPQSSLTSAERTALRACREPIEARIEAIDVELRRGVVGDEAKGHLDELLSLTDALRACAR